MTQPRSSGGLVWTLHTTANRNALFQIVFGLKWKDLDLGKGIPSAAELSQNCVMYFTGKGCKSHCQRCYTKLWSNVQIKWITVWCAMYFKYCFIYHVIKSVYWLYVYRYHSKDQIALCYLLCCVYMWVMYPSILFYSSCRVCREIKLLLFLPRVFKTYYLY